MTTNFDLEGPSYSAGATAWEVTSGALHATLVTVDESGHTIGALPVLFRQRVFAGDTVKLSGVDASGALRVFATVTKQPPRLKVNLRYNAGSAAPPRDLLPAFRFLRGLRVPARLGLLIGERSAGEPAELPAHAEFPSGLVETTRSLAFVQAMTGIKFPMPSELEVGDLRELREAEALLMGGTVEGRWNDVRLASIDDQELQESAGDAPQFRIEFVAPFAARIAGQAIPLGDARYLFRTAVIGSVSADEVVLRPGTDDGSEVSLLAPPEIAIGMQDVLPPVVASVDALEAAERRPLGTTGFEPAAS